MTDQKSPPQPSRYHRVLVGLGLRDTLVTPQMQRTILRTLMAIVVIVSVVATVLEIVSGEMTAFDFVVVVAVGAVIAVIVNLMRSRHLIRASIITILLSWSATLLLTTTEEISLAVGITWFAINIAMTAMLFTEWAVLLVSLATLAVAPIAFAHYEAETINDMVLVIAMVGAVVFMSRRASRQNLIALKQAQQALQEENLVREYIIAELADSEHRYRAMMENTPVCHMVTNLETLRVEDLNPAGVQLFGTTGFIAFRKQFKTIMHLFVHDAEREQAHQRIQSFRSGETQPVATFLLQRADGTPFQARVQSSPATLNDKPVLISIIQDVTERNMMEAMLRQNERLYRAVADAQGDMICRYNPHTLELTFVNEAYARWHNQSPESLTGTRFIDLIETTVMNRSNALLQR